MAKAERTEYQKTLMELLCCRPVAYWPALAHKLGGVKAAVMLSQLLYWNGDQSIQNREGRWILKSVADLEQETGLTQVEQQTAREILAGQGVIECKLAGIPRIWHYRVNLEKLEEILIDPQSHSMGNSLNEKAIERVSHSTRMRRNIDRDSRGMFTHNVAQLNNELKTTVNRLHTEITSSSSRKAEKEEEVILSDEIKKALRGIGVYTKLFPEVAAAGLNDGEILDLITAAREQEPKRGKTAALFMYRLRDLASSPAEEHLSQEELEAAERHRKYGTW